MAKRNTFEPVALFICSLVSEELNDFTSSKRVIMSVGLNDVPSVEVNTPVTRMGDVFVVSSSK